MKLFMFYIGGDCGGSNIELHDIRFSIGESPEACHDDLRRQWWGDPKSLHLDCWGELTQADGFDIELVTGSTEPSEDKLFFLNLGGYDVTEFEELHKNILLIAPGARAATKKALSEIRHWTLPHKDKVFEVEKAIDVSAQAEAYGFSVRLTKAKEERPFTFVCKYLRLT
ncbi:DUF1543 domain-containing protein [Neorhizobium sp. NCHU2750]|uniref:DUF1543 domain-containing protein n=1 Tax=Neorhizobium sp. NCHU2750 TaxID=1825976 RepID=UPI000E720905|nr:hypothetical protein NCHU2750_58590 [Neorhizobium sp. NCHU2750]